MPEYKIEKSDRKDKKYMAVFKNGKKIYFGQIGYKHFEDKTPLKLYSHLDHKDPVKRANYVNRHSGLKNKQGKPWYDVPNTAAYFAKKYLW